MKKLIALLTALMLLALPAAGMAQGEESLPDMLWAASDWSFLAEWGILTEEEAALLSAERAAAEAGREIVYTATVEAGPLTGGEEFDAALADLLGRLTFVARAQRNEGGMTILADGAELFTIVLGEKDGLYAVGSNLLPSAASLTLEDLNRLPNRIVTALQANGLISREDAMRFGMMTASPMGMTGLPWMLLTAEYPDMADLDLTAWNAVLADVQSRRVYAPVTVQPAGCDEATQMWTMTVTAKDVTDFIRAILLTLRDNEELTDAVAGALGYDQLIASYASMYHYTMGSFTQEVIEPLLQELEGMDELLPLELNITAYVNAQGEIVSMLVDVLDVSFRDAEVYVYAHPETNPENFADLFSMPAEPVRVQQFVYNRLTGSDGVTHELLFGDDRPEVYVSCVRSEIPVSHAVSYALTMGENAVDGTRTVEYSVSLGCETGYPSMAPMKVVTFDLNARWPLYAYDAGELQYGEQHMELVISIVKGGVVEMYPRDAVTIRYHADASQGAEMLTDVTYVRSIELDGDDLTGMETYTAVFGGETMLELTADIATRTPEVSIFDGDVARLNDMTDEQLAAWVGMVIDTAKNWCAAESQGWLGEMIRLWESAQAEETYEVEVVENTLEDLRPDDAPEVTAEGVVLHPGGAYDWEWSVFQAEEVIRVNCEVVPDFVPSYEGEIPPPGSGVTYHLTFEPLQAGNAWLLLNFGNMAELDVDTQEDAAYLYEIIVDEDGNITVR